MRSPVPSLITEVIIMLALVLHPSYPNTKFCDIRNIISFIILALPLLSLAFRIPEIVDTTPKLFNQCSFERGSSD